MNKKRIVIILLLVVILLIATIWFFFYRDPNIAVLCYHNIGTIEEKNNFPEEAEWVIDVNNFEEQLRYLNNHHYKTLTLQEFYDWKQGKIDLPYKSVLITFDDGFLSNYHYAFPLLKKYNMHATVFLIGNYMKNQKEEWSGNLKTYLNTETLEACKEEYPTIEFASHSYALHEHGLLKKKTHEELVQDAKQFNEQTTPTTFYCYPFGAYNNSMIQALQETNYTMAFCFGPSKKDYRKASRNDDDYKIPRLNMSYGMNLFKFKLRLALPF